MASKGFSFWTTKWKGEKESTKDHFVGGKVAFGNGFVERNGLLGSEGVGEKVLLALGRSGWVT